MVALGIWASVERRAAQGRGVRGCGAQGSRTELAVSESF